MSDHTCPTCGRTFDSRRGLGVHHSSAHDERLPNRECAECGARFYSEYDRTYCSDECHDEAVSYEGEANPNYRGGKETTDCAICGDPFEYYPSEKEGLYCPGCVETEPWRETPPLDGSDNPRWKGGKLQFECAACGTEIKRYPSDVTGEVTLCGRDCLADWLSEEFTGEGHPNWAGGDTGNYGPGWNRVRREALERDGYECVVCEKSTAEIGRNPDVHHIVPVRVFERSDDHRTADAHRLSNVASLCVDCHRKADFGAITKARLYDLIGVDPEQGAGSVG
jgi:hypothetical protein